jgi:MFS family permease
VTAQTHQAGGDAIPDSAMAWRMAAAAFTAGFVVFGIVYSFGVFLQPMTEDFPIGRAAISAFYSIASLLWYMLGPLTGHLNDRIGPRIMVASGAVSMGAGLVLTAFIEHVGIGYLTYGIGVGLGAACAYVPTLANLGGWFVRKRNAAFGIAAAGTGCGMLIIPPLAASLIDRVGWRLTNVVLGVGSALLLSACALIVAPPPVAPHAARERPLCPVLCSFPFLMMYSSWTLATTALFVPFVFLPQFALNNGATPLAASALLSILGGVSVLSRLGIGILGNRIASLSLFKVAVLAMAASHILWLVMPAYSWLVVFAICLGFAYGLRIAVLPSVLIEFCGLQNLGALLGIFFTATGLAAVIGPLLAGYIVDYSGSYQWGIAFALAMATLGFAAVAPLNAATVVQTTRK